MIGHDNREQIFSVGQNGCAHGVQFAHALSFLGVGYRLSIGDFFKSSPDFELKRGALRANRQIDFSQCSVKVDV